MDWSDMVIGIVAAVIVLVIGTYLADLPKLRKIVGWLLILCSVAVLAAIVIVSAHIIIWKNGFVADRQSAMVASGDTAIPALSKRGRGAQERASMPPKPITAA